MPKSIAKEMMVRALLQGDLKFDPQMKDILTGFRRNCKTRRAVRNRGVSRNTYSSKKAMLPNAQDE